MTRAVSSDHPRVSIVMVTYNHAGVIAQAIESVVMQKTTFRLELIIGEDRSTDRTREIVAHYQALHPELIRAIYQSTNVGMHRNFRAVFAQAAADYVAFLEGDDYWTDPLKLQRQVDFLDANPECPGCFHDVNVVSGVESNVVRRYCDPKPPPFLDGPALLERNSIPTCSIVFRRDSLPPRPACYASLPMGDWPTWLLLARSGPLAYIDEVWGCYRVHVGGVWSSLNGERQLRNALAFYRIIRPTIPPAWQAAANRGEKATLEAMIGTLVHQGRWQEARPLALRYLLLAPNRLRAPAGRAGLYCRLILNLPSATMRGLDNT